MFPGFHDACPSLHSISAHSFKPHHLMVKHYCPVQRNGDKDDDRPHCAQFHWHFRDIHHGGATKGII
jgi:hypothetical protein